MNELLTAQDARITSDNVLHARREKAERAEKERWDHIVNEINAAIKDGRKAAYILGGLVPGLKEELIAKGYFVEVDISETDGGQSTIIKF